MRKRGGDAGVLIEGGVRKMVGLLGKVRFGRGAMAVLLMMLAVCAVPDRV